MHGQEVILTFMAYHIPAMSVHLLSPQNTLEEMQGSEGQLLINKFWLILKSGIILDALFGHAHLSIPHSSVSSSPTSFWSKVFDFRYLHAATTSSDWVFATQSLLCLENGNLMAGQHKLL